MTKAGLAFGCFAVFAGAAVAGTPAASVFGVSSAEQAYAQFIEVDGGGAGRVFDGVGGQSGGFSSKLLMDYPEPQRSQVLDYLFKPAYGAALHHYKIEIGGDILCTCGTTPSFAHTREEFERPRKEYFERGFEWWMMKEAKRRNPGILLGGIECGVPGWVGGRKFYSQDNADYLALFCNSMRGYFDLPIDYLGLWNELMYDTTWIKTLRRTLDANGCSAVKVVAADIVPEPWRIVNDMNRDPALMKAVDIVGAHYPGYIDKAQLYNSTTAAKRCGKPLWSSEDGPWMGDWSGACKLAKSYNRNYIAGRMTATVVWAPVTSYYSNPINMPAAGLMTANTPWSGYYIVEPAIWATAHTTQFAQPGWRYLDGGCSYLGLGGSFVTLRTPDASGDWSMILETVDAKSSQAITVTLAGGLRTAPVHIWRTNKTNSFEHLGVVTPGTDGFTILLEPEAIYSLTTTTGQGRGDAKPPADKPFPLPYVDDFESLANDQLPKHFANYAGVFEGAPRADGKGRCLRQVVPAIGVEWAEKNPWPATYLGDLDWTHCEVAVDALIEKTGSVVLHGRFFAYTRTGTPPRGYRLVIDDKGQWQITVDDKSLASGTAPFAAGTWHRLKMRLSGSQIKAWCDDRLLAELADATHPRGRAGFGSSWDHACFDNFSVLPLPESATKPVATPAAATQAYDPEKRGLEGGVAK